MPETRDLSPLDLLRRIDRFDISHYALAFHQLRVAALRAYHPLTPAKGIQKCTFPANQALARPRSEFDGTLVSYFHDEEW